MFVPSSKIESNIKELKDNSKAELKAKLKTLKKKPTGSSVIAQIKAIEALLV